MLQLGSTISIKNAGDGFLLGMQFRLLIVNPAQRLRVLLLGRVVSGKLGSLQLGVGLGDLVLVDLFAIQQRSEGVLTNAENGLLGQRPKVCLLVLALGVDLLGAVSKRLDLDGQPLAKVLQQLFKLEE